ncbi:hypothetical protein HNQ59_001377 [Chitinivorax tropicus]|uniref:Uncharacterized protein n=1 Tax=Chitinivorax tropicus TaxID=714531 RepID=A0A840MMX7_9PROT|nr:hypothetical protein [Chitinivorax tropicus]
MDGDKVVDTVLLNPGQGMVCQILRGSVIQVMAGQIEIGYVIWIDGRPFTQSQHLSAGQATTFGDTVWLTVRNIDSHPSQIRQGSISQPHFLKPLLRLLWSLTSSLVAKCASYSRHRSS